MCGTLRHAISELFPEFSQLGVIQDGPRKTDLIPTSSLICFSRLVVQQ
jgi:hypothetical protein